MLPTHEQQRIIELSQGSHLVLAPPGTGKTDMLSHRVVEALRLGVPASSMICVTFTVRAAEEMCKRIRDRHRQGTLPLAGNIHQLCHQFLYKRRLVPRWWQVIDENTQTDLMREVAQLFPIGQRETIYNHRGELPVGELINAATSLQQLALRFPEHIVRPLSDSEPYNKNPHLVRQIARLFRNEKIELGVIDFDDLLTHTYRFVALEGVVAHHHLYSWVQVDEAQDLSSLQWAIIESLSAPGAHKVYFGDMEQAIYSFMGASTATLDSIASTCQIHNLQRNFRSRSYLLDLFARYSIRNLKARWDFLPIPQQIEAPPPEALQLHCVRPEVYASRRGKEESEARWVANLLKSRDALGALHDTAVLVPTNAIADDMADKLNSAGVACFKVSGFDLLCRTELRDFLALLNALTDPQDRLAWSRIFKLFCKIPTQREARQIIKSIFQAGLRPADFLEDPQLAPEFTRLAVLRNAVRCQRLVVFDTETTGVNTANDDIIQIAAVEIVSGVPRRQFDVYINAAKELGDSELIHKISRQTLIDRGVSSADGLQAFVDFVGDGDLVAHNATFDRAILDSNLGRYGVSFDFSTRNIYDTLDLARRIHPSLKSYTLAELIKELELEGANTHNAIDDVLATAGLLLRLAADTNELIESQEVIIRQQQKLLYTLQGDFGPVWQRLNADHRRKSNFTSEFSFFINYCLDNDLYTANSFDFDDWPTAETAATTASGILERARKFTRYVDHIYAAALNERPFVNVVSANLRSIRNLKEADMRVGDEKVVVSTIHKAKGLEFETVIVPRCEDGVFPNMYFATTEAKRDEYARLLYVALTRSRRELILLYSGQLSRFIQRIESSFEQPLDIYSQTLETAGVRSSVKSPQSSDWLLRYRQLMHYVQSKSVPTNLAEWLADPDEFVRARAYRLLAFSTARDIREAIPRGLRDNSDEVRLATIEVIAQIGASIDWRLLQPTLYMDNPELQLAAVRALAELDATPALAMLRGLLARGRDPQLRRRILHTLPHYSAHAEALAIARQSLRDIDASVRVVAAEALAKMGEPQWREIIMGTREDQQRLSERLPEC